MKQQKNKIIASLAAVVLISLTGCSLIKDPAEARLSQEEGTGNPADQKGIPGVPGASIPTSNAIVSRIQNGVKNAAVPTSGNFSRAIAQLGSNLPETTNPLRATGYDQVPLLAYAACSDIPLSTYGITGNSIPGAKAAIVAAGINILDQHTGGLASTGPYAAQVSQIFGNLVDQNAQVAGETVQIAFISVCMTASTVGTNMLGF
jgi:hypothetical protein